MIDSLPSPFSSLAAPYIFYSFSMQSFLPVQDRIIFLEIQISGEYNVFYITSYLVA